MKTSALVFMTLLLTSTLAGIALPDMSEKERLHKQISVQTEPEQLEIRKIENFDWVTLPECSHISIQGHPALPMKPIVLKLPRNTELVRINIEKTISTGIPGRYMVAPALKPNVISDKTEAEIADICTKFKATNENSFFSKPLPEIYNSSINYPSKLCDYYSSKGREHNYVMIYFYLVKFASLKGELTLVSEATFDVEYTVEAGSTQPLDNPPLDEVIITAPTYETEANTLATWRNATQIKTAVYITDWIYDNYGGIDEPEKIRNFIGDMFNNTGIKYALLLGDVDDVPTRFAYVPDGEEDPPDGIEVPTEGTWDPNGDGKYADLQEDDYTEIDFIPEISVGRLSVNEATASQVVDKIIQYEKNLDPTWFNKMILAGTDPFTGPGASGAEGEILKDYAEGVVQYNFTTFTKLYETEETLSASTISESVNTGSGAFNYAGHGHYALWDLGTGGIYTNDNAASLTNGYKLPVIATMACLTAGFDSMYNPGNCIGEEFLRNPNGGTAAYVGSTRDAWGYIGTDITEGLAGELDWRFWESYELGIDKPGPMLSEAKVRYIASHPLNTLTDGYYLDEKTVLQFVLLGDPALFLEKPSYILIPHNVVVKPYRDSSYSQETKFFTIDDAIYIEASVTDSGGENISDASVFAELYTDSSLEMTIPLTHLGENSSLYRGCFYSNSSSTIGVYSVNAFVTSPHGSASGGNRFHLYPSWGVSAYQLDWDEDGNDDYVLESEHLISVFDRAEYTSQPIIYLYQKDSATAYTFGKIADPDSIGKGEITTSNVEGIKFSSFSTQKGENLTSSYLDAKVDITIQADAQKTTILIIGDDGNTQSADLFNTVLASAEYAVTQELASVTNPATWANYDILVWAASDDTSPIHNGNSATIDALVTYVNGGGRLIIEGGEIGYQATHNNWNTFMSDVLHIYDQWFGDWPDAYAELAVEAPTHPVRTTPNMLPDPILFTFGSGTDYGTADWLATTDGQVVYQWNEYVSGESVNYGEPLFGAMAYDNDDDTSNGGQIIFLSFDILDIDDPIDEKDLIENMANWLIPQVTTSFNLTITMRNGSVDYLVYRLHNFDQNISDIDDIFSDITGTHGLSVSDDRYHLEDGTDGLITSLTAEQWNEYALSDYVCVYDNSTSADSTHDTVMAWVRFNETQTVAYQGAGLWNDTSYRTEGLRIRYNVSEAVATDEVSYMLVFTEGNWKNIDQWMPTIKSGLYPDPNFNRLIDVAVISVEPSPTEVYPGQVVNITVVAKNEGTTTETFNVTTYYDANVIGTQTVTGLTPDGVMNMTFSWNTSDVTPCVNYTIKAEASVVPLEIDINNNNFTDGYVKVKMMGDINGDAAIDIYDLTIAGMAYGSYEGDSRYDPEADLNKDGHVDMRDIIMICRNYGKNY